MVEKDTQKIKIQIPREEITFLDMVFKSYEGLAVVTVDNTKKGLLTLDVTEGTKDDVLDIIHDLQKKFPINIVKS